METQDKEFAFAVDTQIIVWERSYFTVKARTSEEAEAKVIEAAQSGTLESDFEMDEHETLHETVIPTGKVEVVYLALEASNPERTIYTED